MVIPAVSEILNATLAGKNTSIQQWWQYVCNLFCLLTAQEKAGKPKNQEVHQVD